MGWYQLPHHERKRRPPLSGSGYLDTAPAAPLAVFLFFGPGVTVTRDEFRAHLAELRRRRDAAADAFLAVFPATPRYVLKKGARTCCATRNMSAGQAPWRLTHFHDGVPTGHQEYSTLGLGAASHLDSLAWAIWSLREQGFDPE